MNGRQKGAKTMELKSVIDQLGTCAHCLFPFERDCYQFLCGVSEERLRMERCNRALQKTVDDLHKTIKTLTEENARLRAQLSDLSEEGKNGLDA